MGTYPRHVLYFSKKFYLPQFDLFPENQNFNPSCFLTSGKGSCRSFWNFQSKFRNVGYQTSTFKMADPAGTKTVEKAKKEKRRPTPTEERECPRCHHPEGGKIRNCGTWQQKDRFSAEKCQMRPLCLEDEEWCQRPNWRSTLNCNVIGAYPCASLPFTESLDDVWSTRSVI